MSPPPNFSAGLHLAFRARFGWLAVGSLLALTLAAFLSAQFSGRQPTTVALDIGLSVIRLLLPLVLVLMTQELLSREFDRRYFLNTLSYPHPRHSLLLGRFIAVSTLTLGLLLALAGALALLVWLIGRSYAQGTPVALGYHYLITIAFIGLDLLVLTAVATLLAVVASTPSFVLIGTFGFMLIARSFGTIVELLTRNTGVVTHAEDYRVGIGFLGYLLPDLGALDVRMIALYGKLELLPDNWPWLVLSSLIYTISLLALAAWALQRKRFA
ncbi:ABC-type transport system involved in multi-copper enzyme maturation, permease component [Stutzerimonas stutzeri]|uniref:ABC transporter permease subunit n=1 Tax=Stutzerimonas stutzeri subgroup TaxID=578833 RepID=UPI000F6FF9BF|nr:ABC transporter permease subunit [Stutzerimonas stutzeri]VEI36665.1 ABC-type transport system involved in multi-copper enzyme maturation, permease component [Stutzerimonas stutzeri]